MFENIQFDDTVTILTPHGQKITGKARIRNRQIDAWVLNCGGRHGTPRLATPENVVKVRKAKK